MKLKYILWSWDFILSVGFSIIAFLCLPYWVPSDFAKDLYSVGISVLSIVFSVYFAALAIIMSSSDDDFIHFLEEKGHYTIIIQSFEFSLAILFVALIYSIGLYAFSSYWLSKQWPNQEAWYVVSFAFLFFWGMLTAASSTLNAITYSKHRTKFLRQKRQAGSQSKPEASGS